MFYTYEGKEYYDPDLESPEELSLTKEEKELLEYKKEADKLKNEFNLDILISSGDIHSIHANYHVDFEIAKIYYYAAIELDSDIAMVKMADLYLFLKQNYHASKTYTTSEMLNLKEALRLYHKASEHNNTKAIEYLANAYYKGIIVEKLIISKDEIEENIVILEKDLQKSYSLYERLANLGNIEGNRWLAFMYYYGIGVDANFDKSFEQYQILAKNGDWDAVDMCEAMKASRDGTTINYAESCAKLIKKL